MELLYWIDRTLTSLLQMFARFVEKKLHVPLAIQRIILLIVGLTVGNLWADFAGIGGPMDYFYVLGLLLVTFTWSLLTVSIEFVLQRLHVFFDYEGAYATDKLYENGYKAWSGVVASVLYIGIGFNLEVHTFISQTVGMLLYVVYLDFVTRRKGPGNKRQRKMTEALQALLERCRDFIPLPEPLPEGS